jgi:hypothetical protein
VARDGSQDAEMEYECPTCGAGLKGTDSKCPSCGLELDWSSEPTCECPECGGEVASTADHCDECGARFVREGPDGPPVEDGVDGPTSIDEILEDAIDATTDVRADAGSEDDAQEVDLDISEEDSAELPEMDAEEPSAPGPSRVREDVPAGGPSSARRASRVEGRAPPRSGQGGGRHAGPRPPEAVRVVRLYPGGFSRWGLALVGIALVALAATLLVVRWDTLVLGAEYETVGRLQWTVIALGVAVFLASAALSVVDILRSSKGTS